MRHPAPSIPLYLVATALILGCDRAPTTPAPGEPLIDGADPAATVFLSQSAAVQKDLAAIRRLTAPFHSLADAQAAGYNVQLTPCLASPPLGAQGVHFGDVSLIDGTVDLMGPEVLVYEPRDNGSFRLVSVEYIVPIPAWQGADPPMLLGQHFHRNDAAGIYALHVWLWRHNPSGLFADWNPKVSC